MITEFMTQLDLVVGLGGGGWGELIQVLKYQVLR